MSRVTVSVPEDVKQLAEEMAEEEERSVSSLFAEAVEEYVCTRRRRQAARRIDDIIERTTVRPGAVEDLHRQRRESDRAFPQKGPRD